MSDWKYDLDEVGEDADSDPADADSVSSEDGRDASGDGPDDRERGPIEPGTPTAENALFVTLGVATTLFLFARVILVAGG